MKKVILYSVFSTLPFFFSGCSIQPPAIFNAAKNNDVPTIENELNHGVNIESKDDAGRTPLYWAAWAGKFNAVKYLVDHGANINASGEYGYTALHGAAQSDNLEIAKYLVERGAIIDVKNAFDDTPADLGNSAIEDYLEHQAKSDRAAYLQKQKEQEQAIVKAKEQKALLEQQKVQELVAQQDLTALKEYTEKHPDSVYYISDPVIRLALTGPKGMKVGDIRKLLKEGRSEGLVVSLIKRVKEPYKEYTIEEIDILSSMGLSDKVIAAMIDVTTKILEDKEKRAYQEYLLAEQKKVSQESASQAIVNNSAADQAPSSTTDTIKNEIMNQGAKKIVDYLF